MSRIAMRIYTLINILSALNTPMWHYEEGNGIGPSTWFTINGSELCSYSQQSPIQINPTNFIFNTQCNTPFNWNIDNTTYNFTVSHKGEAGYTILFTNNLLSNININNEYILSSFHFHWGNDSLSGSEHIFNDIPTTLEIHFVHYHSNYTSAENAIESFNINDNINKLSVIGILFEEVNENATTFNIKADNIIYKIANDIGMDNVWRNASDYTYLSFSITDLFDINNLTNHYYHYQGSLTTPPCTPTVKWLLGQTPIKIRTNTMDLFRSKTKLWENGDIDSDRNYRPIQKNPNCVYTCVDNDELKYCPTIIETIDFPDTYWHYEDTLTHGPSDWMNIIGGELCNHPQQSPIEINPLKFDSNKECYKELNWNVDDTNYAWTITHKGEAGHTLDFKNTNAKANVYLVNEFQKSNNHQHARYNLYSFHLHWGEGSMNGSEHIFTGVNTQLEIHFVHYSHDYLTVGEALKAWQNLSESVDPSANDMHTLAVAGFLFEEVGGNESYNVEADNIILQMATDTVMDMLWSNATGEAYLSFAITDLVDAAEFMTNYYHYQGSLTTPPCTPAVNWHLAQSTIKIRKSTMDLFRAETRKWNVEPGNIDATRNFRPIQTNPSCVWTCGDRWCPDEDGIDFPDWHYEDEWRDGPSNWKNIPGGELCGHPQQSPILIDPNDFTDGDICAAPLNWHVDDTVYNWTVTHKGENGHTLNVFNYNAKSVVYLENSFQYNGNNQHEKYKLYSLHFHWGPGSLNGSEHVYKNITTTFEVHFVHYSVDYNTIGDAVGDWERLSEVTDSSENDMHTLGVVGFLFEEVGDNEGYNRAADSVLLQFVEDTQMRLVWQNATGEAHLLFPITDLVDVDDLMENYYHYEGSLTTPPCTPAVRWHLAQNTIKVRKSTMDLFRTEAQKWNIATGHVDSNSNFRPVQPNINCVYTCSTDSWCPGIDYPDWHYEENLEDGPSNWKNIPGGALCGHEQQSPILIDPNKLDDGFQCDSPLNWHVDDTIYNWTVTHKGEGGHTLNIYNAQAKADVYLQNSFQYNGNNQHEKYKFYSLHFHWGSGSLNGSEHVYKGITTTFEVHFVHYSSDYDGISAALADWSVLSERSDSGSNDMHTLGVVGFLFEEVENLYEDYNEAADNILLRFAQDPQMDMLWENAIGEAYLSFSITDLVNIGDFQNNYYHYWGSLTTPPCTPAVSWHLAQNTIKVRKSTMDLFRIETKKWKIATGFVDSNSNFRPIQSNPSCVQTCDSTMEPIYKPTNKPTYKPITIRTSITPTRTFIDNNNNKDTRKHFNINKLGGGHFLWYLGSAALVALFCSICLLIAFCCSTQKDLNNQSCDSVYENSSGCTSIEFVYENEESFTQPSKNSNAASFNEIREGENRIRKQHGSHSYSSVSGVNNDNDIIDGLNEEEKETIETNINNTRFRKVPSQSDLKSHNVLYDNEINNEEEEEEDDDTVIMDDIHIHRRVSRLTGQSLSIWCDNAENGSDKDNETQRLIQNVCNDNMNNDC